MKNSKVMAALANYELCFNEGRYTAARSWWLEFVSLGGLNAGKV